jgi:RHH-type proline utilization regulon transcriptional repressor/proline dehydrogenase/delta 1-pyrroline-5-carboxylate dehydrogenase
VRRLCERHPPALAGLDGLSWAPVGNGHGNGPLNGPGNGAVADGNGAPSPARGAGVAALRALRGWLSETAPQETGLTAACDLLLEHRPASLAAVLPGPTGERNVYTLLPRQRVLCQAGAREDLLFLLALVLSTDGRALWADTAVARELHAALPAPVRARVALSREPLAADVDVAVAQDAPGRVLELSLALAQRPGAIVPLLACAPGCRDVSQLPPERLMVERSLCVNTAAAGGNAGLMAME